METNNSTAESEFLAELLKLAEDQDAAVLNEVQESSDLLEDETFEDADDLEQSLAEETAADEAELLADLEGLDKEAADAEMIDTPMTGDSLGSLLGDPAFIEGRNKAFLDVMRQDDLFTHNDTVNLS